MDPGESSNYENDTDPLIPWEVEKTVPEQNESLPGFEKSNLWTCLTLAASMGRLKTVQLLVEKKKADIVAVDALMQLTPLEHAARF